MNFLYIFALALLISVLSPSTSSSDISQLFETWCKEHGKSYTSQEERSHRLKVFEDNYVFVTKHNSKGNSSYTLALNAFADLTHHEFKTSRLGLSAAPLNPAHRNLEITGVVGDIPASIDWRNKGAVTSVKDQGSCGACWSFSATGAIEGINKIVTGSLVSLSEQELIECDKSYNDGCGGGLMDYAFQFVMNNHGIDTEEDYPYRARDGTCNKDRMKRRVVTIDKYVDVPENNEKQLLQAVAVQPVSVGICGSERAFQMYSKGIFTGPCSTTLDHAVLIVGYGSENGVDYWIVKNSWGTGWGMRGYMHMQRNSGNSQGVCGINMLASYPQEKPAAALANFLEFAFHGNAVDWILPYVVRIDSTVAPMITQFVTRTRTCAISVLVMPQEWRQWREKPLGSLAVGIPFLKPGFSETPFTSGNFRAMLPLLSGSMLKGKDS
ncbi:hypothetical protein POTOM_022029 [Populus tomentosa]|uniref:Uncharacterized protein n=1 Tax=Populus tomentosa TaxID=118781 RepID=A0A8X8D1Y2_POPTO|nr:hypothetical protein POTOM_022029 [Populus tomentosa]